LDAGGLQTIQAWIVGIGVPVVGALFVMTLRNRELCVREDAAIRNHQAEQFDELEKMTTSKAEALEKLTLEKAGYLERLSNEHRRASDMQTIALRADFNTYQLKIAETVPSNTAFKDFDDRMMEALLRLDRKVDGVSDRLMHMEGSRSGRSS